MEITQAIIDANITGTILKDNPNGGAGDDYQEFCEVLEGVLWKPDNDTPDDSSSCHHVGIVRSRGTILYYEVLNVSAFNDHTFNLGWFGKLLSFGYSFMRPVANTNGATIFLKSTTDTAIFQNADGYTDGFALTASNELNVKQYDVYTELYCSKLKAQLADYDSIANIPMLVYFIIEPQKAVTYSYTDPTSTSQITAADYKFRANAIGKIKSITFNPMTLSNSWKINSFKADSTQVLKFNSGSYADLMKAHCLYTNSDNNRTCYIVETNVSQETIFTINTDVKNFSFTVHYE